MRIVPEIIKYSPAPGSSCVCPTVFVPGRMVMTCPAVLPSKLSMLIVPTFPDWGTWKTFPPLTTGVTWLPSVRTDL